MGTQVSFAITSKIKHEYYAKELRWNGARRSWEETSLRDTVVMAKARGLTTFSWTIPFGIGFRISENVKMETGMEYFNSRRTKQLHNYKKYSEGAMFQLAIRFNL